MFSFAKDIQNYLNNSLKRSLVRVVSSMVIPSLLFGCSGNVEKVETLHTPQGSYETSNRPIKKQTQKSYTFEGSGITIDNLFPGGRVAQAMQLNGDTFEITTKPENTPINDSPWYAFRVKSSKGKQTIVLQFTYVDGTPRYHPKLSENGQTWYLAESASYAVDSSKNVAFLTLVAQEKPTWVSAQELLTSDMLTAWGKKLATSDQVERSIAGHSVEGKPIDVLRINMAQPHQPTLVLMGRGGSTHQK